MKRKEIETLMKKAGVKYITLVFNREDPLGMLCQLEGGVLVDCLDGKRVPIKQEIWGILIYEKGVPVRYPIEEKINEVLLCK